MPFPAKLATGLALTGLLVPGVASAQQITIYSTDAAAERLLVSPAGGERPLSRERGAFRQEKSSNHLFGGAADAPGRLSRVTARQIKALPTGQAIANLLQRKVDEQRSGRCLLDGADFGCASGIVTVDEIGNSFNDRKGPDLARRLSQAMVLLERTPHTDGGTYAQRIQFYMAPAFTSGIGKGLGRNNNLGRDGKPKFATWLKVFPALARAGAVHLEMYHFDNAERRRYAFTNQEWVEGPRDVAHMLTRFGGGLHQMHFLVSPSDTPPAGSAKLCAGQDAMECQWTLALRNDLNTRIARNGVGLYRGDNDLSQTDSFLRRLNAFGDHNLTRNSSQRAEDKALLEKYPADVTRRARVIFNPGPSPRVKKRKIGSDTFIFVKMKARSGKRKVTLRIGRKWTKTFTVTTTARFYRFRMPRTTAPKVKVRVMEGGHKQFTFRFANRISG